MTIWILPLYQLLCTGCSDLAAGRAGRQVASGFSSVPPVNNLELVGDKPFKIYKPTKQNPNSDLPNRNFEESTQVKYLKQS